MSEQTTLPGEPITVLLGGGIESTLLVRRFLAAGEIVIPVHVHCGLIWDDCEIKHVERFLAANSQPRLRPLISISLPLREYLGGHWAVTGRDIPQAGAPSADLEIPLRNLTLLSFAVHKLAGLPGIRVALGTTADNCYRDGSRDYFDRCQALLALEAGRPVEILTPWIALSKTDVIRLADASTLALSFSCVNPRASRHCGRCIKCGRRRQSFGAAGVIDPTEYADSPGRS
ncbi:MAG: 7-cyano-7-deazaguanine synthase [Planctomycetaceae bacterium]